jgi:hypothetical protein
VKKDLSNVQEDPAKMKEEISWLKMTKTSSLHRATLVFPGCVILRWVVY